jgi:Zn-dependent M28 family amino/carboxypeptidase
MQATKLIERLLVDRESKVLDEDQDPFHEAAVSSIYVNSVATHPDGERALQVESFLGNCEDAITAGELAEAIQHALDEIYEDDIDVVDYDERPIDAVESMTIGGNEYLVLVSLGVDMQE